MKYLDEIKAKAKRVTARRIKEEAWRQYREMEQRQEGLDIVFEMLLPSEVDAQQLAEWLKAHIARKAKIEKVPDVELEMLFKILRLLENIHPERQKFNTQLEMLFKKQLEYWENQARMKSKLAKELDENFKSYASIFNTLSTIHDSATNP